MKTIKKYSNRRLYDTDDSEYITLERLAGLIREGHDVEVVDAESGEDLTQATLAQIVVESRGAARLLPVPLLTQMIRMEEDALAEFMGLYMSWALDVYFQVKRGFRDINPYQFLGGNFPFDPTRALGQLFGQSAPWNNSKPPETSTSSPAPPPQPAPVDEPAEQADDSEDLASLRQEIQRLNERLDAMDDEDES